MLKCFGSKDTNDAIGARAIEATLLCRATEGTWHFDIHPLEQLPLLIKDIDVAVRCQNENFDTLDGDTHENLLLHFGQISRFSLDNRWRFVIGLARIW